MKYVSAIGSIASICALFFIQAEWEWWKIIILAIGIISGLGYIFYDYRRNKPIKCTSENQINEYMYNWISTQGKVNVFSRDLSWVDNRIKHLMIDKGDDLCICAEHESDLLNELKEKDVNVFLYGNVGYNPKSRFTVIRANKASKQIAIAKERKSADKIRHHIYEFDSDHNTIAKWILNLSSDLVELVKCVDTINNN